MSTDDLVKSVARKLKYYFEVKRLEDGFDLCDLHQLSLKNSPSKTQPAHKHDSLHDRALKQYFSDPDVRFMLTQLNSYDARGVLQGWREIEVRKMLDNYMKHYTFQFTPCIAHPSRSVVEFDPKKTFLPCCHHHQNHRKKPQSAGVILHRRKPRSDGVILHRRKPRSDGVILHRRKQKQNNLLRSCPVKRTISDQHITKGEAERLVNSATKILCGSELSSLGKISYSNKQGGRSSASVLSKKKGHKSRSPRNHQRQMYKQPHSRSTSPAQSSRSSYTSSRSSSSYSHSSSSSVSPPRRFNHSLSNSHTSKDSPRKNKSPAVINMPEQKQQAQVGIERSTQTDVDKKASEPKTTHSDNPQKDSNDKTPCEYQVVVRTGDRLGSGTAAPVKLTLFGDKGRSEEFDLSKMSKRHKMPFQKGNEDLFLLSGNHVGQLRKVQIGHDKAQINYAWFLENVAVYDMHTKRVYQFPCGQWLSGQDGDKKTYRILEADSERKFAEAPDASMNKSMQNQKNDSRPAMSSETANKSTLPHSKLQDDSQNSSNVISSNVRVESSSARFNEGGAIQRGKKDDYEQKATKITLRSVPGSKVVDEIILENGNDTDTNGDPSKDFMESDKSLKPQPDQKKQRNKEIERKSETDGSIHAAVRDSDLDRVKELLQRKPQLKDQRDENGWRPLHLAASSGNMEILRWLITSGADIDARTPTGLNAMHVAALSGHVNIMVILQTRGASILSCTMEEQSALHLAAKSGYLDCVKWLVANGAALDTEDKSGNTPFRLAETHHHGNCADFLRVCVQELGNNKSTFAQVHARQVSGDDLKPKRERTASKSSQSSDDDKKGKSSSNIDNGRKHKKNFD